MGWKERIHDRLWVLPALLLWIFLSLSRRSSYLSINSCIVLWSWSIAFSALFSCFSALPQLSVILWLTLIEWRSHSISHFGYSAFSLVLTRKHHKSIRDLMRLLIHPSSPTTSFPFVDYSYMHWLYTHLPFYKERKLLSTCTPFKSLNIHTS